MPMFASGDATRATGRGRGIGSFMLTGLLLAAYLVVLLPVIPSPSKFHGDERFYTDAAMQMVESGDYWTPRYADGRIRLHKPILTYWVVACSFQVFGISLFAARLPFLLAGVSVVYLTGQMARTVMNSSQIQVLAALVIASNVELMTLSTQATPDVLVCLFVLLSMLGFARIWFQGDRSCVGPLLAFGGVGLAVQTKGLLGLCPLAANALFWMVAKPAAAHARRLLNWPAITIGICVGAFWYAAMLYQHGPGALKDFYADQVGDQLSGNPWYVFANFGDYLYAGVRYFLPWTLLLLAIALKWRPVLAGFWRKYRNECIFLLGLFAVLVVVFSLGNARRPRYLAASYPLLAVLVAALVLNTEPLKAASARLCRILRIVAILLSIVGAGLSFACIGTDWRLVAGVAVLVLFGITGSFAIRSLDDPIPWIWVAGMPLVVFGIFGTCIRPVFSPSPLVQSAEAILQSTGGANTTVYACQVSNSTASKLRLLSRGRLTVKIVDTSTELPDFSAANAIITTSPGREVLERAGYTFHEIAATDSDLAATWLGRLAARFNKRLEPSCWIAIRPSSGWP